MSSVVRFGPFTLDLDSRSLHDRDAELRLGARALDLLIALVKRGGDLVTHDELLDSAWRGISVDESSLRVHMSALRKALGDGQSGARYIINDHGRGYCFVGQTTRHTPPGDRSASAAPGAYRLPAQIVRMLGREDAVQSLSAAMDRSRLVTIAGPGGIGKSTLAIAWAERHADRFRDGVRFVDMLETNSAESAVRWIAASLGVGASGATTTQGLANAMKQSQVLLLLDNCEHLIDFAVAFVEAALLNSPGVQILVTSRETLRANGETVFRLAGLSVPEDSPSTVGEAALYPAVELFLERATASAPTLRLTDGDIGIVGDLCRRLDGIPLAIELAAGWVDVVGVRDLAAQLDRHFLSLAEGRRTASPRQRSLAAALEWSYAALDADAQLTLTRLSVFRASFSLASAIAVVGDERLSDETVARCINDLARKSLVQVDISGDIAQYRLLETTRTYALDRLTNEGGERVLRLCHARNCCVLLERAEADILTLGWGDWLSRYGGLISDARAALTWAFSAQGDAETGVLLTLRSLQFGLQFPLFGEYIGHIDAALAHLRGSSGSSERDALRLEYARGMMISNTSGDIEPFKAAATRSRALEAETGTTLPDGVGAAFGAAIASGNYPETLVAALRIERLAADNPAAELRMAGLRMRAQAEHFLGHHDIAEGLALDVLAAPFEFLPLTQTSHKVSMRIVLARIAFLKGDPDLAKARVAEALTKAGDNPSAICQTLGMAGVPIGLWTRNFGYAAAAMEQLREVTGLNVMVFWADWLAAFDVALRLMRDGIRETPLDVAHLPKVVDMLPTFDPRLLLPEASRRVADGIVGWNAPEVLRAQALATPNAASALRLAREAAATARAQGAIAWTQRADTTLQSLSVSRD